MTQSNLLIALFSFFATGLFAQNTKMKLPSKPKIVYDTLTIYDTLFVTDTVRLLKQKGDVHILEKLSISSIFQEKEQKKKEKNNDFLILNQNFAATFSTNSILLSDNKNNLFTTQKSDKMKKISFFGVVLFAFQHMVVAQNNFSISLGTGYHQVAVERYLPLINPAYNGSLYKTTPAMLFKVGVNMERPMFNKACSLLSSLNYAWLGKTDYNPVPNAPGLLDNPHDQVYRMNHHFIGLPLSLRFNTPYIKPMIGAELYYKQTPFQTQVVVNPNTGVSQKEKFVVGQTGGASLLVGADIPLYTNISARIVYTKGVTRESGVNLNQGEAYLKSKMNKLEVTFLYGLAKNK